MDWSNFSTKEEFKKGVMEKRRWGDSQKEDNKVLDHYNSLPSKEDKDGGTTE